MTTAPSALIVGAGLAGLSAAYRLQQAGWRVTVLEREAVPGGRARSVRLGDCTVDLGATVLLGSYAETFSLVRELGLDDQVERVSGQMAVPRDGRVHSIDLQRPVASLLRTPLLRAGSKLALAKLLPELLRQRKHLGFRSLGGAAGLDTETLAHFCARTMPAEAYDYLLNPMLKFLYLHNGETGSLTELLWWLNNLGVKPVYSFKSGTSTLIDALAQRLTVRCRSEVTAVHADASGVDVEVESAGGRERLRADHCLVTVPAPIAAHIARDVLAPQQASFLGSRVYDRHTVVTFCTKQRPALDALMVQMPDAVNSEIATLVFQHQVATRRAPPGKGIVNAYFMQAWSERYLQADDATTLAAATEAVRRIVPEVAAIEASHVHRWRHAAALTETGACARIQGFIDASDVKHPVQFVGDYLAQASLNVAVATAQQVTQRWIRAS